MKILVTGAKGMLGQDLCPILEDEGYDVLETDKENLDITNELAVEKYFKEAKPDIVVHCAAYTKVDKAEQEPQTAELINSTGTAIVAKAASKYNSLMIYISTDYVFDGTKKTPYLPNDKTCPLNIYGKPKLEGEKFVEKYCKKYYIIRTSWLYGIHGENFVEKIIELSMKKEIKIVCDQIGSPTWTVELAGGITELIDEKLPYGIYHISGSGQTTWFDFAKEILEIQGYDGKLIPCKTSEYPSVAIRPAYSYMESSVYTRRWEAALRDYMILRPEGAVL